MDTTTLVYFLSGVVIVLIFAINYFNQPGYNFADEGRVTGAEQEDLMLEPALPKYLTDRFEYNLYLLAYVLVTELFYVMLVLFLPDLVSEGGAESSVPLAPTRQNIVLATLIITGIAPNLPYVKTLLEKSKEYLHDKAQIPGKGRQVYQKLKGNSPRYDATLIKEILSDRSYCRLAANNEYLRPDLSKQDFNLDSWTLGGRWAKLSYLVHTVQKWAKDSPFRGFIGNRELRYSTIERTYHDLYALKVRHEEGTLSESEGMHLNSCLDATLHRTYRLISCLLYLSVKSDSAVNLYLEHLGYASDERQHFDIPWRNLVFMVGAIIVSIVLGGFAAYGVAESNLIPVQYKITTHKIFAWAGYAVPFLTLPSIFVLCVKRYLSINSEAWPVVNEANQNLSMTERPWHIYAIVSLAGYTVGGVVLFASSVLVKLKNGEALNHLDMMLRQTFVWAGIVLVTVAFLSFRLDSSKDKSERKAVRFLLYASGSCLQGLATMLAVYIAFIHTVNAGEFNPLNLPDPDVGKLIVYCVIAFFLGVSLYLASGFNILRQRRQSDRLPLQSPVLLRNGDAASNGLLINLSRGGALIESDGCQAGERDDIIIATSQGHSAPGRIIKKNKNRIHVAFDDADSWQIIQSDFGRQLRV